LGDERASSFENYKFNPSTEPFYLVNSLFENNSTETFQKVKARIKEIYRETPEFIYQEDGEGRNIALFIQLNYSLSEDQKIELFNALGDETFIFSGINIYGNDIAGHACQSSQYKVLKYVISKGASIANLNESGQGCLNSYFQDYDSQEFKEIITGQLRKTEIIPQTAGWFKLAKELLDQLRFEDFEKIFGSKKIGLNEQAHIYENIIYYSDQNSELFNLLELTLDNKNGTKIFNFLLETGFWRTLLTNNEFMGSLQVYFFEKRKYDFFSILYEIKSIPDLNMNLSIDDNEGHDQFFKYFNSIRYGDIQLTCEKKIKMINDPDITVIFNYKDSAYEKREAIDLLLGECSSRINETLFESIIEAAKFKKFWKYDDESDRYQINYEVGKHVPNGQNIYKFKRLSDLGIIDLNVSTASHTKKDYLELIYPGSLLSGYIEKLETKELEESYLQELNFSSKVRLVDKYNEKNDLLKLDLTEEVKDKIRLIVK
jgi:hypothetical protein